MFADVEFLLHCFAAVIVFVFIVTVALTILYIQLFGFSYIYLAFNFVLFCFDFLFIINLFPFNAHYYYTVLDKTNSSMTSFLVIRGRLSNVMHVGWYESTNR